MKYSRFLSCLCVVVSGVLGPWSNQVHAGNSIYNSAVLADGPLAFWSFDETTGTVANDSATTAGAPQQGAQNGTFENCTLGAPSGAVNLGTSITLNGTSARARFPYVSFFDLAAGDFSVELWYKTTSTARGDIFNFKTTNDFGIFANQAGNGTIGGWHNGLLPTIATVPINNWYHVVYVRTGGTITLYVNGVASGSQANAQSMSSGAEITVGDNKGGSWFAGSVDEVAYYPSALSAARVSAHYAAASQTNANAPVVVTGSATGIAGTSATLNGSFSAVGSPNPNVTIYWGPTNGGTVPANWANTVNLGAQSGAFSTTITGLVPATTYYFIAYASNASGTSYGSPGSSFVSANGPPSVSNVAATNVLASSATLGAQVTNTGGVTPTVTVYYGTTDGGTTVGSWTSSVSLGTLNGTGTANVTNLTMSSSYFFRALATNSAGSTWAASSTTFSTPAATLPTVTNTPATDITGYAATLRGTVTATGNDPPVVKIYYGTTDGGTTVGSWTSNVTLPAQPADFAKAVGGLAGSTTYFYRAWAQNAAGSVWAPSSSSFTTTSFTPRTLVINEIHYHPVEKEAFNIDGTPVLDLTNDVHEFVEIFNNSASPITLDGYKLEGGIGFTFPAGTTITAGGYRVIAKNPARLITVYSGLANVLGPYSGVLGNNGDTVRLEDATGNNLDEVSYEATFPWATGADAMGAAEDFTLVSPTPYQYKGRSLQRVSAAAESNDPANWLASALGSAPTPASANAVTLAVPAPVGVSFTAVQSADDAAVIRAAATVRVTFTLSSTAGLFNPQVEYFVDTVNSFAETHSFVPLTSIGNNQFTAVLPAQVDRSVVRYRFVGNLGAGTVQLVPRLDDARIVPVSFTSREAWCSYFVTPVRTSVNQIYELFVSSDGTAMNPGAAFNGLNGLQNMGYNSLGNPKRATTADTNGVPRDVPYVPATAQVWNGSVPAIFVENGRVRDAHIRLHGSRYNRNPARQTYKLLFSDTQLYQEADSQFITDKSDYFSVMHGLYQNANLPVSGVRWIDWYMNGDARAVKLEQGEYNGDLLDKFHTAQAALNPGTPKEESGEFYKDVGIIAGLGEEGPYSTGDGRPWVGSGLWSTVQKYQWTYLMQSNSWKGATQMKGFLEGMWTARGDTVAAPNPNVPALRAYLDTVMDVDTELTSMAILSWACPWDDTSQNHFFWQRANGKWAHFPWDFDGFFGNGDTTGTNSWIYLGETGTPAPATNTYGTVLGNNFRGPNYFKDSFFKAYRTEYDARLWVLNNTYLHPDTLKTIFFTTGAGAQQSYYSYINAVKAGFCEARFASVNVQLGKAADGSDFLRPAKPTHSAPLAGATALPASNMVSSVYTHSSGNTTGGNAHAKSKWELRHSAGTYLAPIMVTTSTTNLTSMAIPFADLTFGQTYFWRVTYIDASDHPSLTSAETSFIYGPQASSQTIINFGDAWKYNNTTAFTDNTWAQPAFNDSAWTNGNGVFYQPGEPILAPGAAGTVVTDPRNNTPAGRAYLFRKHFNFPANPLAATIRIRHYVDDGCVIWINGQKVHRYFMNEQANYTTAEFDAAAAGPGEAAYQYADAVTNTTNFAYIDPRPFMVQGDNVIAIEVHQVNATSSDIVMGLEMTAVLPALGGDVVINEIMANGGSAPDYIELKNNTNAIVSLTNHGLTDDILNPTRYVFPAGTTIPANGYLAVYCDNDLLSTGLHTGFGLSAGGQAVVLTNAGALRDRVPFGPQARGLSIGRVPDGTGAFVLTTPTLVGNNAAVATLGSATNLKVNEWLASPAHGDDWFEIYNADANPVALAGLNLRDNAATLTQIPPLSFIAGKGYTDFIADGTTTGFNRCNFKLSGGGDSVVIVNSAGTISIDTISFGAQQANVSQGRLPDGGATVESFPLTRSRAESNWLESQVVINELQNYSGNSDDFIELANLSASAVDISGWWLSDNGDARQKYQFPSGTVIPAGGFLSMFQTQFGAGAIPFAFGATGESAVLTATIGGTETGYRSEVKFGTGFSIPAFGRVLTGNPAGSWKPEFWPQTARTPGTANSGSVVKPVIINEVHYHPSDLLEADNVRDEFVELHNPTTTAVDLSGWILKGASDYTFPNGTTLRPGDYIVILGFDPVVDTTSLAAFRAATSMSTTVPVFGPFTPKLPNDEADVELGKPVLPLGSFLNVDKVSYADVAPWTTGPDGSGSSLQRTSRTVIGNDPANWVGAIPTPGQYNSGSSQTEITDNDGDGIPNIWELANGLDPFSSADAALDPDGDGQSNVNEYLAQTNPNSTADVLTATCTLGTTNNTISFTAKANVTYSILVSSDLNPTTWAKLTDIPAGAERPITVNDPATPNRRFYKLTTPQVP
jgi:hypothetical protein